MYKEHFIVETKQPLKNTLTFLKNKRRTNVSKVNLFLKYFPTKKLILILNVYCPVLKF